MKLKFYGRRCVLEQSLRVGDSPGRAGREFAKILLASKSFLLESKTWKIYNFVVEIKEQVYFYFKDVSTHCGASNVDHCASLTVEKASRVVKLLNPSFAAFYVYTGDQTYLQLLGVAEGELALYFNGDFNFAQDLITQYWPRLYGLKCNANRITNLPRKKFNYLVAFVRNTGEMRSVMRHDAKLLELILLGEFLGEVEEFQEVGRIQYCDVYLGLGNGFLNFIRNVKVNCKDLKSLPIEWHGEFNNAHEIGLARILFNVEATYRIYSQLFSEFLDSPVKTNVEVQIKYFGNNFMLPVNWMAPLLANERLQTIKHETTVIEDNVTTVFSNEQARNNLEAKFNFELNYQYGENEADNVQLVNEDVQSESDEETQSETEDDMCNWLMRTCNWMISNLVSLCFVLSVAAMSSVQ